MWTGTIKSIVTACLLLAAALAIAKDVGLVWVETPAKTKYATWESEESRANLSATIAATLETLLAKEEILLARPEEFAGILKASKIDLSKSKDRTLETYGKLATETSARFLVFLQVRSIDQKNAGSGEILSNLGKPQSDTKVEVFLEIYNVEQKSLVSSGSQPLRANFQGPYFGTTKKGEIHGDPVAEAAVIRNENRKRMQAAANAVWLAVKDMLLRECR